MVNGYMENTRLNMSNVSKCSVTEETRKKLPPKPAPKGRKRGRVTDLPPCTICGEKASGLHYGVNSCEACKAFFYRNVKRADVLTCEAEGNCHPVAGSGYKCPACRMQKCLQLGMSLTVFKKGRYSYERRAYLKKEILTQATQITCADSKDVFQCTRLSPDTTHTNENESSATTCNTVENFDSKMEHLCEHLDNINTESGTKGTQHIDQINEATVSSTSTTVLATEDNYAESTPGTSNELTKPLSKLLSEEEIISMVRLLNELYNRYPQFPPEYYEKLKIVQQGFLDSMKIRDDVFGKMDTLPEQDFLEIYRNTGMDIDGRLEGFKVYYPELEKICTNYVQYARELPGFDELGAEDQIALLKGSKSSFSILGDYTGIDVENEIFTTQNFDTLTKDEMEKLFSKKTSSKFFSLARELYELNLNQDQLNRLL